MWAKLFTDQTILSNVTQRKKFMNTEMFHVSSQSRHGTEMGMTKHKVSTRGQKYLKQHGLD
jgi:hypothetical protein